MSPRAETKGNWNTYSQRTCARGFYVVYCLWNEQRVAIASRQSRASLTVKIGRSQIFQFAHNLTFFFSILKWCKRNKQKRNTEKQKWKGKTVHAVLLDMKFLMINFGQRFHFWKYQFSKRKIMSVNLFCDFLIVIKLWGLSLLFCLLFSFYFFLFLFLGSLNTFCVETLVFAFPIEFLSFPAQRFPLLVQRWAYVPRASTIPTDLSIFNETKRQDSKLKWGSDFSYTIWKLGWLLEVREMKKGAEGSQLLDTRL